MEEQSGFAKRTKKKKEKILASTMELFLQKGSRKTTVAEIASFAGVSQVSIYNYFESKDGLTEVLIRNHLEKSLASAEEILNSDMNFKQKLEGFMALGKKMDDETDDRLMAAFDWQNPAIQGMYARFVADRQVPFLIRFIELGKISGDVLPELSTEAILAYFNANMQIYSDPQLLQKGKEYIANLSHLFFYGILGR